MMVDVQIAKWKYRRNQRNEDEGGNIILGIFAGLYVHQ